MLNNINFATRGSASSSLVNSIHRTMTPYLPFKTIALTDAYDFFIEKGKPSVKVVKIMGQAGTSVTAKIGSAIGGRNRMLISFPKKGDVMYAIQAVGDDMPVIFSYPNGFGGNLNNATSTSDEKFISFSGSYVWYKSSGSYNQNIKLNGLMEIGKDYTIRAKNAVYFETKSVDFSSTNFTATCSNNFTAKSTNIILNSSNITIGGSSAIEPAVLGAKLKLWCETHTHIGNLGYPTGTPIQPFVSNTILSQTTRIK